MLLTFLSDTRDDHAVNSLLGNFQTTSSNTYFLLSRNLVGGIMQHGDLNKLNYSTQKSTMVKNLTGIVCSLNNISSIPYILLSINIVGCVRQQRDSEWLQSPHPHIEDGHALNNHLGIIQTISSSKPYILLSRHLIGAARRDVTQNAKIIPL